MQFFVVARVFHTVEDRITLRDVWNISDLELNDTAEVAWKLLSRTKALSDLNKEVAWLIQAVAEFGDLSISSLSHTGLSQYKSYLFWEAMQALRESTVGLLNGLPRASIGLLRSVLEMMLLHCWWQKSIEKTGSTDEYDDWLGGVGKKPKFTKMVKENFDSLEISGDATTKADVHDIYGRLCAYVHTPVIDESVTLLNEGNALGVSIEILDHWLILARDTLKVALEHLIHLYPQCLFPVDIIKKFGFNPPVGMYFAKYNFVPLQAVFSAAEIESFRSHLQNRDVVELAAAMYESRPDLTDSEILETWEDQDVLESINPKESNQIALLFKSKAQLRALDMTMTYSKQMKSGGLSCRRK